MSGGSHNYLSGAEAHELVNGYGEHKVEDVERMIQDLKESHFPGSDLAVKKSVGILNRIREIQALQEELTTCLDEISDVWHMQEWVSSGDCLPEDLAEALSKLVGY